MSCLKRYSSSIVAYVDAMIREAHLPARDGQLAAGVARALQLSRLSLATYRVLSRPGVAHPVLVHLEFAPRLEPLDLVVEDGDVDVAAARAARRRASPSRFVNQTRASYRKFLSMRAPTGQRSTTLSDSGLSSGMPGKTSTTLWSPRLDHAELAGAGDLVAEPDAAGADDAAVAPDRMFGPRSFVCLIRFVFLEPRHALAVLVGVVLQVALAGLVADRAVERVVDQHVLEDRLAAGVDLGPLGGDLDLVGDRVHAGRLRASSSSRP